MSKRKKADLEVPDDPDPDYQESDVSDEEVELPKKKKQKTTHPEASGSQKKPNKHTNSGSMFKGRKMHEDYTKDEDNHCARYCQNNPGPVNKKILTTMDNDILYCLAGMGNGGTRRSRKALQSHINKHRAKNRNFLSWDVSDVPEITEDIQYVEDEDYEIPTEATYRSLYEKEKEKTKKLETDLAKSRFREKMLAFSVIAYKFKSPEITDNIRQPVLNLKCVKISEDNLKEVEKHKDKNNNKGDEVMEFSDEDETMGMVTENISNIIDTVIIAALDSSPEKSKCPHIQKRKKEDSPICVRYPPTFDQQEVSQSRDHSDNLFDPDADFENSTNVDTEVQADTPMEHLDNISEVVTEVKKPDDQSGHHFHHNVVTDDESNDHDKTGSKTKVISSSSLQHSPHDAALNDQNNNEDIHSESDEIASIDSQFHEDLDYDYEDTDDDKVEDFIGTEDHSHHHLVIDAEFYENIQISHHQNLVLEDANSPQNVSSSNSVKYSDCEENTFVSPPHEVKSSVSALDDVHISKPQQHKKNTPRKPVKDFVLPKPAREISSKSKTPKKDQNKQTLKSRTVTKSKAPLKPPIKAPVKKYSSSRRSYGKKQSSRTFNMILQRSANKEREKQREKETPKIHFESVIQKPKLLKPFSIPKENPIPRVLKTFDIGSDIFGPSKTRHNPSSKKPRNSSNDARKDSKDHKRNRKEKKSEKVESSSSAECSSKPSSSRNRKEKKSEKEGSSSSPENSSKPSSSSKESKSKKKAKEKGNHSKHQSRKKEEKSRKEESSSSTESPSASKCNWCDEVGDKCFCNYGLHP